MPCRYSSRLSLYHCSEKLHCKHEFSDFQPSRIFLFLMYLKTYYLETLRTVHIVDGNKVPPPINLDPLRKAGIPVVAQHIYEAEISKNKEILDRRSSLWAMVKSGGHTWEQVLTMPKFKADLERYKALTEDGPPNCV